MVECGDRPWIVDDELWALIEPLLPPRPQKVPDPEPVDDRLCRQGILYMLYNDISRQLLPVELGFGSGRPAGTGWAAGRRRTRLDTGPAWMPPTSA